MTISPCRRTWVDRHDVPEDTTGFSLTAEMIEQFRIGAVK